MALTCAAQAALVLQGNGVEVLDTDTNLLWLYDCYSSGFNAWADSRTWAAGLTVGGAKASEWRLPEIDEYAGLWIDPDVSASEAGLRANLSGVGNVFYWSGTEATPTVSANFFDAEIGGVRVGLEINTFYAAAVRDGNAAGSVPEPHSLALVLLALTGGVVARLGRSR